jgi:hypothetical protein
VNAPTVKSRKPTCVIPYPLVLLEGEEKAGKSWAAMLLSASPKVGATYVLDLGEGGADEYGLIPGARFEILEHDGTWAQILERVMEVKAAARYAKDNGQPPVVLVIDSATDLWNGLKAVGGRAVQEVRDVQAAKFAKDPNGEHKPTQNLWNDANARHRRLMTQLMTFPGVVVMTARGKEVTEVKNGKPVEGSKVWSVEHSRTSRSTPRSGCGCSATPGPSSSAAATPTSASAPARTTPSPSRRTRRTCSTGSSSTR